MNRFISTMVAVTIAGSTMLPVASAQTSAQSIQTLLQQIQALQAQMDQLRTQQKQTVADLLTKMTEGSEGENVKILQGLLAADPSLYPEGLITGFFGKATGRAVARFQKKHGLEQVGFVGPRTLSKLKELLKENPLDLEDDDLQNLQGKMEKDAKQAIKKLRKVCAKIPPGHTIAPGWLRKHDGVRPIVPICQNLPPGIITNPNNPPVATSTPDTVAPLILNVASNVGTSTAMITWSTNENADSQVAYGSTDGYGSLTTLDPALVTAHSQTITGLAPVTTYHYRVSSKDVAGNLATSTDKVFTTGAVDATAPDISGVSATPYSGSAVVMWSTNEPATTRVYYSTSSVDVNTSLSVLNLSLVMSHSATLSGLAASSTYNALIESSDSWGNKSTTSTQFTTTN